VNVYFGLGKEGNIILLHLFNQGLFIDFPIKTKLKLIVCLFIVLYYSENQWTHI